MVYNIVNKDDYDKVFKIENKQILCYSKSYYKDLPEDEAEIVGEMYKYKPDEDADNTIVVSGKSYPVFDPDSTNRVLYGVRGYVEVADNQYIALYWCRLPFLFWLLGIALVALIALMMVLKLGDGSVQDKPSFNPLPPVDSNIEVISDDELTSTAPNNIDGGEVTLDYSASATLNLSTKNIDIDFTNPSSSSHEVVLELYVVSVQNGEEQEYKIAESGRIPAGSKLTAMTFSQDSKMFESEGIYDARYHLKYYNPQTGEKSLVDSVLDKITLTVKN